MEKPRRTRSIVLVGDLVASRRIAERSAVQEKLLACLRKLNSGKRGGLVSPYALTLGDEFQAVFSSPDRVFRDALTVLIALYPVEVRFSCAVGEINTAINKKQAIGMDGPVFHDARATVNSLKKTKSLFAITAPDLASLPLQNQSLALVSHALRRWPKSRLQILLAFSENRSVKQIARDLRVTEQAVYKSIDAGAIRAIVPLFHEVIAGLANSLELR